jgi:hypothetical protein
MLDEAHFGRAHPAQQAREQGWRHRGERPRAAQGLIEGVGARTSPLGDDREALMQQGRRDPLTAPRRLDKPRKEQPHGRHRQDDGRPHLVERVRIRRQFFLEHADPQDGRRSLAPPRASQALPQCSQRARRADLGHGADGADIDAEFQR